MRILLGVQARSRSTRLKHKVLHELWGKPIISHMHDIMRAVSVPDGAILDRVFLLPPGDIVLTQRLKAMDADYWEDTGGDENDLVARYSKAAGDLKADIVVRVTADCPAIPPMIIDACIEAMEGTDYCSNTIVRSYPEGWDVQACTRNAMKWFDKNQVTLREHPFSVFDENRFARDEFIKAGFSYRHLLNKSNILLHSLSVDRAEDVERMQNYKSREDACRAFMIEQSK